MQKCPFGHEQDFCLHHDELWGGTAVSFSADKEVKLVHGKEMHPSSAWRYPALPTPLPSHDSPRLSSQTAWAEPSWLAEH